MTDEPPEQRPAMPGEAVAASPRTRLLATVADLLLVLTAAGGAATLLVDRVAPDVLVGIVVVASAVPTLLFAAGAGRSIGKVVLRLDHVRPQDGPEARPDPLTLGLRWAVKWLVPIVMVVAQPIPWTWALLWWLVDGAPALVGERRAVHDLVAGTRVWELVVAQR